MEGIAYYSRGKKGKYFVNDLKANYWYWFNDLKTLEPIFSDRDSAIKEIGEERLHGYSWAGIWP